MRITTGAIRCAAIRSAAAIPSSTGILTSRMTRSGRSSSASATAPGAVAGLADDVVALLGEHLGEVHPDQRLVLGDDDRGAGRAAAAGSRRSG